jgi:hypothetical protein
MGPVGRLHEFRGNAVSAGLYPAIGLLTANGRLPQTSGEPRAMVPKKTAGPGGMRDDFRIPGRFQIFSGTTIRRRAEKRTHYKAGAAPVIRISLAHAP